MKACSVLGLALTAFVCANSVEAAPASDQCMQNQAVHNSGAKSEAAACDEDGMPARKIEEIRRRMNMRERLQASNDSEVESLPKTGREAAQLRMQAREQAKNRMRAQPASYKSGQDVRSIIKTNY